MKNTTTTTTTTNARAELTQSAIHALTVARVNVNRANANARAAVDKLRAQANAAQANADELTAAYIDATANAGTDADADALCALDEMRRTTVNAVDRAAALAAQLAEKQAYIDATDAALQRALTTVDFWVDLRVTTDADAAIDNARADVDRAAALVAQSPTDADARAVLTTANAALRQRVDELRAAALTAPRVPCALGAVNTALIDNAPTIALRNAYELIDVALNKDNLRAEIAAAVDEMTADALTVYRRAGGKYRAAIARAAVGQMTAAAVNRARADVTAAWCAYTAKRAAAVDLVGNAYAAAVDATAAAVDVWGADLAEIRVYFNITLDGAHATAAARQIAARANKNALDREFTPTQRAIDNAARAADFYQHDYFDMVGNAVLALSTVTAAADAHASAQYENTADELRAAAAELTAAAAEIDAAEKRADRVGVEVALNKLTVGAPHAVANVQTLKRRARALNAAAAARGNIDAARIDIDRRITWLENCKTSNRAEYDRARRDCLRKIDGVTDQKIIDRANDYLSKLRDTFVTRRAKINEKLTAARAELTDVVNAHAAELSRHAARVAYIYINNGLTDNRAIRTRTNKITVGLPENTADVNAADQIDRIEGLTEYQRRRREYLRAVTPSVLAALTDRQLEVIVTVAKCNNSIRAAARRLGISAVTVLQHLNAAAERYAIEFTRMYPNCYELTAVNLSFIQRQFDLLVAKIDADASTARRAVNSDAHAADVANVRAQRAAAVDLVDNYARGKIRTFHAADAETTAKLRAARHARTRYKLAALARRRAVNEYRTTAADADAQRAADIAAARVQLHAAQENADAIRAAAAVDLNADAKRAAANLDGYAAARASVLTAIRAKRAAVTDADKRRAAAVLIAAKITARNYAAAVRAEIADIDRRAAAVNPKYRAILPRLGAGVANLDLARAALLTDAQSTYNRRFDRAADIDRAAVAEYRAQVNYLDVRYFLKTSRYYAAVKNTAAAFVDAATTDAQRAAAAVRAVNADGRAADFAAARTVDIAAARAADVVAVVKHRAGGTNNKNKKRAAAAAERVIARLQNANALAAAARAARAAVNDLTDVQITILDYIRHGVPTAEIARKYQITNASMRERVTRICKRIAAAVVNVAPSLNNIAADVAQPSAIVALLNNV